MNNVLREYNQSKDEIKNLDTSAECDIMLIYYMNMVDINRETYERNGVETKVDSDRRLCLNEKHLLDWLDQ